MKGGARSAYKPRSDSLSYQGDPAMGQSDAQQFPLPGPNDLKEATADAARLFQSVPNLFQASFGAIVVEIGAGSA